MKDNERLWEAIGDISDVYIREPEEARPVLRHGFLRNLAAACLVICLIALPVHAEMVNGYVSNLLAPLYGGAQTEIVDKIGVPVGASTTVGDYCLTADAVIGDRYNIAVVFSLTRTDGGVLPEGIRFDDWWSAGIMKSSGGGSLAHTLSEDRKKLYVIEQWTGRDRLFWINRDFQAHYRDLVIWNEETQEQTLLQEGDWMLRFTIRYEDTTQRVWKGKKSVTGNSGETYTLREVLLSPIGIHLEATGPNFYGRTSESHEDFTVSLILTDGRSITFEDYSTGYSGSQDAKQWKIDYGAMFETPIPRNQIQSLVFCGTEIPLAE